MKRIFCSLLVCPLLVAAPPFGSAFAEAPKS